MPLEFALRPRIRLRDDFAAPPHRSRLRLPRFALPVLGYWLAIGGISYALVHAHDSTDAAPPADEPVAAVEPQADVLAPALPSEPEPTPAVAAAPAVATAEVEPEPASAPPPAVAEEQEPLSMAASPRPSHAAAPRQERLAERTLSGARPPAPAQTTLSENDIAPLGTPFSAFEPPSAPAPEPARSHDGGQHSGGSLPSCEAAAAAATQDLDFASSDRTADLPSSAIAGVLENGAWLSSCGVPEGTSLEVCVAIKGGRVTAATVVSRPADSSLNACLRQRAAALQFPYSSRVDIARTRF
ncbi:MAG TPA: hypothetical protein VGF76_24860 [Polyangiaceae bacterium]